MTDMRIFFVSGAVFCFLYIFFLLEECYERDNQKDAVNFFGFADANVGFTAQRH